MRIIHFRFLSVGNLRRFIALLILISLLLAAPASIVSAAASTAPGIVYTNNIHGYTLTFPAGWDGLYRVEESADGMWASIYNLKNENTGSGGYLFGIIVTVEEVDFPGASELTRNDGRFFYVDYPTDVQFDPVSRVNKNEYERMFNEAAAVVKTLNIKPKTAPGLIATPTFAAVVLNARSLSFEAYTINGYNYFKLRDLAYALRLSVKQFDVEWVESANTIALTSGKPYTVVGGEMVGKGDGEKTPYAIFSTVLLDGVETEFEVYNIEYNNYFKLRDIAAAFDFGIDWNESSNTIFIDTMHGYTP